jgi:hypothetical protein
MESELNFFFLFFFYCLSWDGRESVLFLHRFGASLHIAVYLIASNYATRLASKLLMTLSMLFQHGPSG